MPVPIVSNFEITKRSPQGYRSLVAPTGASSGRGIAYIEDTSNPGNAIVADGSMPIAGFVTRSILLGGPTVSDIVFPRIELPFEDGTAASFEQAEEVQAEGYDAAHVNGHLYSSTGGDSALTITGSTPVKTLCSFRNGQFCIADTGDYAEWMLVEQLTPRVTGNVRCRFTKVHGQVVAAST